MEEAINDIVTSLTKTVKALQMYGINHPSFKNFYKPFYQKMATFLKEYNELKFKVERFIILHEDRVVYEEEEKDINIAFRLFRDGIRSIAFARDLSSGELLRFLEIIGKSTRDYDTALNLWESDFPNIDFYVVEEEDEKIEYKIPEVPAEQRDYDQVLNTMIRKESLNVNEMLVPALNFEELKLLKEEIYNEEKDSPIPLTINTLIKFLNIEKSDEVIESLIDILKQCIDTRDFHNARKIVHNLLEYPDINVIEKFENETTILGFQNIIEKAEEEIFNEFIAFIGYFSKESIPQFIKLLRSVKRQDRVTALKNRIAYIAQDDVTPFKDFLKSDDLTTLQNVLSIIGMMKSKDVTPLLKSLQNHPEKSIRAEVVLTLENINEPSIIAQFINDPERDVRIKALHALSNIKHVKIYSAMLRAVKHKDFLKLDFAEQKEYFNCLVANRDQNFIKVLKKMLFKWLLFGRKKYRIMRQLAAMALAQIDSEESLEILRVGARKGNKDIKSACEMALKGK